MREIQHSSITLTMFIGRILRIEIGWRSNLVRIRWLLGVKGPSMLLIVRMRRRSSTLCWGLGQLLGISKRCLLQLILKGCRGLSSIPTNDRSFAGRMTRGSRLGLCVALVKSRRVLRRTRSPGLRLMVSRRFIGMWMGSGWQCQSRRQSKSLLIGRALSTKLLTRNSINHT